MTTNPLKRPVKSVAVILYVACLSLLLWLGGWQLKRGFEKTQVEHSLSVHQGQIFAIDRAPAQWPQLNYKIVELQGNWVSGKTFLLDNRVSRGRVGFELLSPFRLAGDDTMVLVNRGWTEKRKAMESMPMGHPSESIKVKGQLYLPEKGFTLGPALTMQKSWPKTIQYIDHVALSDAIDSALAPVVVVMDPGANGSPDNELTKIWVPYVINASRHYGYAAQWWGLALVLVIFGFIWNHRDGT